jgi:DNA-binding CsgD family transcriptional regulator
MRVLYLEHDRRLTRVFEMLCRLADIEVTVFRSEEALIPALSGLAHADTILLDCSSAEPADTITCARIVTQTASLTCIIHPQESFVRMLDSVALCQLVWLVPDFAVLSTLQVLHLLRDRTDGAAGSASQEHLTVRESAVFEQIYQGCSDGAIALGLGLSINTVKTYVDRIKQKFHIHKRQELVAEWRRIKLGDHPAPRPLTRVTTRHSG